MSDSRECSTPPYINNSIDDKVDINYSQGQFSVRSASKRVFDIFISIFMALILIPLLISIAVLIIATDGWPVIIKHRRIGRGGRPFSCFKFRTMVSNGDEVLRLHLARSGEARSEWETTRKLKDDPRVTYLGRALRKSSVDELPQLLNILRGDMSLVGPRPIVADEVRHYGSHIQKYYRVRPGLTGSWQVGGRNDASYARRIEMDVDYVETFSFGGDLLILAKTVPAVLTTRGSY